ncbi:hypothetical protein [Granulicella sp. S156]|jgi:hypothetical protein|uniref:hypothetical protein n=1 Tax=Granulicella sp. S156 TaxID=1747224 RepID=UPI00131B729A|nr:hypothetical protein [Granulicella sp. S156]
MPNETYHRAHRHEACNDQVIGAILSGWRYDISGIPKDLRGDYEAHLRGCTYCRRRQRLHRTVDILLLAATTLSFVAFLLAALVMHKIEAYSHISGNVHVHLHGEGRAVLARIPDSIAISLETVACTGVFVSLLLWVLVAIATPIPGMLSTMFRERISPEERDRLRKQAA